MTALNKQALRSKARSASAGEWIKESGDGWEAICSTNDQANGNFIIAHFEGPDAKENREFSQAANPDTVLALLDELEAAEKRIAELVARTVTLPTPYPKGYGLVSDKYNFALEECADAIRAAGIGVKGE
ncbi:ead/Ea22-like family protein [Salmonella enterica]|nr:ead/Ea22-like family protein [Salmonella enterica subsp. enterica serovar Javiana]EDU9760906.1 ead/Ea22-like family protein [Salmonella enterica]EDX7205361.1 ead/Ea22-like family protein [Salmonella enterica]EFI5170761.1 ead/Ea22-like family protein [Salmonella enterica]EJE5217307.1 ead/Ea22-like family protein [Salmonella enterica]